MATEKPRHRSGYTTDELEQVKSTCLTIAVTLGPYLDDIRIVGGLVPALIIDSRRREDSHDQPHPGTNDLDVGLALALLDEQRYAEVSARLRAEGFQPDTNERGAQTVQRWKLPHLNVTIDFLIPPSGDADDLVYVARHTPGRGPAIAERLVLHAERHASIVAKALSSLARDFESTTAIGPQRAARFALASPAAPSDVDDEAADAHGYVDDILQACEQLTGRPWALGVGH